MTTPPGPSGPHDEWASARLPDPEEPPRHPARNRGSHAAPPTALRSLVKSLVVVVLVAAGVALLIHWRGTPTGDDGQGPVVALPTSTPSPSLVPSPTTPPTRTPSPRPTRTHASPTPSPTHSPPAVVAVVPLSVLNNSTISGLASRSAQEFHAKGWPIAAVGNFTGRVAETTVYYTPGADTEHAAATKLVAQFPGITRISERFSGLPGSGLTVVLTRYYAG